MKVIYYNNHQDVKVLIAGGLAYGRSLVADGLSVHRCNCKIMCPF